jgi:hypothetical protein
VVIDGAKALRPAVLEVFDHPIIQRLKLGVDVLTARLTVKLRVR